MKMDTVISSMASNRPKYSERLWNVSRNSTEIFAMMTTAIKISKYRLGRSEVFPIWMISNNRFLVLFKLEFSTVCPFLIRRIRELYHISIVLDYFFRKKPGSSVLRSRFHGTLKRIRTSGLPLRRRLLYPAELSGLTDNGEIVTFHRFHVKELRLTFLTIQTMTFKLNSLTNNHFIMIGVSVCEDSLQ